MVPLALGLMLLLLFAACGKFRQAALMMSVVPLALFGGMLALNVRGNDIECLLGGWFLSPWSVSLSKMA